MENVSENNLSKSTQLNSKITVSKYDGIHSKKGTNFVSDCQRLLVLILFINLILLLAGTAKAFTVMPGPGWDESNPRYILSKEILIRHLNENYYPEFLNRSGLVTLTIHPGPLFLDTKQVAGYAVNGTINMIGYAYDVESPNCSQTTSLSNASCLSLQARYAQGRLNYLQTFNHEFFHIMDQTLRTDRTPYARVNLRWNENNPEGFVYSETALASVAGMIEYFSAVPAMGPDDEFRIPSPGFITRYASYGQGEDKAEIYGWAMASPEPFSRAALGDPQIAAKLEIVKEILMMISNNKSSILPKPMQ